MMWRKRGKSNYQNGQCGDRMETVWEVILLWRFCGKINLEIVWGFHGESMANQITRQSPY